MCIPHVYKTAVTATAHSRSVGKSLGLKATAAAMECHTHSYQSAGTAGRSYIWMGGLFIYLKGREGEMEPETFHLLVHSSNAWNTWGQARLKLGVRNCLLGGREPSTDLPTALARSQIPDADWAGPEPTLNMGEMSQVVS